MMTIWFFMTLLLGMSTHSSATYCVCKEGGDDNTYQKTIDYACGTLADCTPIVENGPCYEPDTVKSHCDYAVNSYFQKSGQVPDSCNFNGVAAAVNALPTTVGSGCTYPTSGSGSTSSGNGTSTGVPGSSSGSSSTTTGSGSGSGSPTYGSTTTGTNVFGPSGLAPTGLGFNDSSAPPATITTFLRHLITAAALTILLFLWG